MKSLSFSLRITVLFSVLIAAHNTAAAETGWRHESELGLIVGGGNTRSETYNAKQVTAYQWPKDLVQAAAEYYYSAAKSDVTARQWESSLRYERTFATHLSGYFESGAQGDPFAGIDKRLNSGLGGKYFFIKTEELSSLTELGYRFIYESRLSGAQKEILRTHAVRTYFEITRRWQRRFEMGFNVEYLPDITSAQRYRINFSPSFLMVLTDILSVKMSYKGEYNNDPADDRLKYDYRYMTSLVARL